MGKLALILSTVALLALSSAGALSMRSLAGSLALA
jgi:hypothetical protein